MNIEEAIKHCNEVASKHKKDNELCSREHLQLAKWLEELNKYKRMNQRRNKSKIRL
jgi:hypothetical protein